VSQIIEISSVEEIQARVAPFRAMLTTHPLYFGIRTQTHLRVANLLTGVEIWTLHWGLFDVPATFAYGHSSIQRDGGNFVLAL
jgi:hypothetical protein